jgi:heme exporter protein D
MTDAASEIYYVWAAYGAAILIVAAITLYTLDQARVQKRALAELEAKGIRRRSATPDTATRTP